MTMIYYTYLGRGLGCIIKRNKPQYYGYFHYCAYNRKPVSVTQVCRLSCQSICKEEKYFTNSVK